MGCKVADVARSLSAAAVERFNFRESTKRTRAVGDRAYKAVVA
jgi:hypothetical protein